jgi:hypothetical protein
MSLAWGVATIALATVPLARDDKSASFVDLIRRL